MSLTFLFKTSNAVCIYLPFVDAVQVYATLNSDGMIDF